jgi:hypothetical protein
MESLKEQSKEYKYLDYSYYDKSSPTFIRWKKEIFSGERDSMIRKLNDMGENYTESHGIR